MPALKRRTADVRQKSVYEPAEATDGVRVLVTQYWPRGVPKAAVDEYVRALAPTRELLHAFRSGGLDWEGFRRQYLELMDGAAARVEIQRLAELARRQPVTLLCVCRDERCHRSVLQELIAAEAAMSQ